MKGINNKIINSNKYHLFTKAEINILSKTYVDYRKDKMENLKESFTLSNLFTEENTNSKIKSENKNEETKSSILAPFNSVNKSNDENDFFDEMAIMDDFNNNRIKIENDIIKVGNRVKEFNMLYELNNNCEVDNGIIINSRTNTISSKLSNNSIYINKDIKDNEGFIFNDKQEENINNDIKDKMKEKDINKIFVSNGEKNGSINKILAMAKERRIVVAEVNKNKLHEMAISDNHQGVIAIVPPFEYCDIDDILECSKSRNEDPFILILDGIEDPHNLGAIIRTVEAAGITSIIIPKDRAVDVNETVMKTSTGALNYVKIARVTNLVNTINTLKDRGYFMVLI